jgi:hypothetical protein
MMRDFQSLEVVTTVAPLGLRFRDVVTNTFVGDGLSVTAYPAANNRKRVAAFANRAGVYVLQHAPGLGEFERGAGDEDFWANLPPGKPFVVEVEDDERRFLPFSFTLDLPQRRIYRWLSPLDASPVSPISSPPDTSAPVSAVPLYSAPTRTAPAGLAVLRAELWNPLTDAPASYAVVEARTDGQLLARGIADDAGRLALIFPYPQPVKFAVISPVGSPVGSPPAPRGPALLDQAWPVTLSAGYTPATPPVPPPDRDAGDPDVPLALPDLRATLTQLLAPPATLWLDYAGGVALPAQTLGYGRELTLKSNDATNNSPPAPRSVLFITPA